MATKFEHRLIFVAPLARVAAVVTRLRNRAGADACPDDLGPGLSPSGNPPATHRWCDGSFDDTECRGILLDMCQAAGVPPPTLAEWNGWTRQEKRQWFASVRNAILSGFGVYVTLADNEGAWDDPVAVLATNGLQVVSSGV